MGKASSSKKVARAASTGGGRTARGRTPWGWYSSIFLVVVVGTLLIVVSRIHVEPQNSLDTGKHATLGRFVSGEPGFKLTRTTIQYPGEKVWHNGDKCPDGKAGKVVATVWDNPNSSKGTIVSGDPNKILIKN